jgi:uncharacterized protein (TIGR03435 family)
MRQSLSQSVLLFTTVAVGTSVLMLAQAPPRSDQKPPAFEAVSLKPGNPNERRRGIGSRGNQFEALNSPLKDMISFAYDIPTDHIFGGPKWIESDLFTIEARPSTGTPLPNAGANLLKLMLRSLMEERFRLTLHRETRIEPIYELVLAKAGPKLKGSTGPDVNGRQGMFGRPGYWVATNQSIGALAGTLSRQLGRTVSDKTGLTGNYDFTLTYSPELAQPVSGAPRAETPPTVDPGLPSIFTALQEQLGLKLESTKGSVDVLVIDHVEHPTPD